MDLSGLSDSQLEAASKGDFSSIDDATLEHMAGASQPQQPQQGLSDIPGNAAKDVGGMLDTVRRAGQGIIDFPGDVYQSGKQLLNGGSASDTPVGQDVKTLGNVALQTLPHGVTDPQASNLPGIGQYRIEPGTLFRQYQDLAAQPLKSIPGKVGQTMEQAYPGNPLIEHPLNSALALAPLAKPLFSAAREIPGVDQGLNKTSDYIRENIVAPNSRRTLGKFPMKMPIEEQNQVGLDAMDKGIIKNPITSPLQSTPKSMLSRVSDLNDSIGESIGNFLNSKGEGLDTTKAMQELDQVKGRFFNDPEIVAKVDRAKEILSSNSTQPVQDKIIPGKTPQMMDFSKGNNIKSMFQKKVNYFSDAANQDAGKAIAGSLRNSIDSQLDQLTQKLGSGDEMQGFLADKKDYASTSKMQDALTGQVNRDARNMPVSLPGTIVGAAAGGLKGLMYEWTKRYGSATAATIANDVSKLMENAGTSSEVAPASVAKAIVPAVSKSTKRTLTKEKAREFLDQAKGDKNLARKLATKADYSW